MTDKYLDVSGRTWTNDRAGGGTDTSTDDHAGTDASTGTDTEPPRIAARTRKGRR